MKHAGRWTQFTVPITHPANATQKNSTPSRLQGSSNKFTHWGADGDYIFSLSLNVFKFNNKPFIIRCSMQKAKYRIY